ncbi:MAG: AAA family ATPase [Thermodesulfatator sp.]|nr:MAG: AAA family ATPase [Thermodesulfatator sp.]
MRNECSYLAFFNLKTPPFSLIPDAKFFFPGRAHLESLEVLTFALHQGSLLSVLIGEPGLGKTQLLLTLLSRLEPRLKTILIYNPALTPQEFFKTFFKELSLDFSQRPSGENFYSILNKDEILKRLKAFFTSSDRPFSRCLLVIDEAQLLPKETLEELRLLTNLNEGQDLILQVFLIGQPTLSEKLKSPELSPLRQRISVWENLRPFQRDEVFPYLWFRIKQASESPEINFDKKIEKVLYKWSKGVPRLINKLMDRALFVAYVRKERTIKKGHLKKAKETFPQGLLES